MATAKVDWGDGTTVEDVTVTGDEDAWSFDDKTHTYAAEGVYTITVTGLSGGVASQRVTIRENADLVLTVNAPASQTVGVYTEYTTRLQNQSTVDVPQATGTYTFWWDDDRDMYPGVVYLETEDGGTMHPIPLSISADGKKAVGTSTYPIPPSLDATSDVAITVGEVGTLQGRSEISDSHGVLVTTDYDFTVEAAVPATGATAGTPGTWTPPGSTPPASASVATGITATPNTAWTTGQYVQGTVAGAAGRMTWSGTNWVGGVAP
jgi:hypothetical protein